jgi:hypothetical protein
LSIINELNTLHLARVRFAAGASTSAGFGAAGLVVSFLASFLGATASSFIEGCFFAVPVVCFFYGSTASTFFVALSASFLTTFSYAFTGASTFTSNGFFGFACSEGSCNGFFTTS